MRVSDLLSLFALNPAELTAETDLTSIAKPLLLITTSVIIIAYFSFFVSLAKKNETLFNKSGCKQAILKDFHVCLM